MQEQVEQNYHGRSAQIRELDGWYVNALEPEGEPWNAAAIKKITEGKDSITCAKES